MYQLDFSGEIVVSGTYEHSVTSGHLAPCIAFFPDSESLPSFPKANTDNRIIWFTLNNYKEVKDSFGEVGSSGKATITIKNYLIDLDEVATSNRADLITVVKLEAKTVEETIVGEFKNYTKENVIKVFYEDFDADGVKEAFILTGDLTKDEDGHNWTNGKGWFASQVYRGIMLQEGLYTHSSFEPGIMTIEDIKLLHVKKAAASKCIIFDIYPLDISGGRFDLCNNFFNKINSN